MKRSTILMLTAAVEAVAILIAVWLGARLGTPAFGQLRPNGSGVVLGLLASGPPLVGLWLVLRLRRRPVAALAGDLLGRVRSLFADCDVISLAIMSAMAGIGEEALFRGTMQTALAGRIDLWSAVLLTSVLFGLVHFISLSYGVYAALLGAYFGVLLASFDNLLVPILTHAAYDFVGLIYLVHVLPGARRAGAAGPFDVGLEGDPAYRDVVKDLD